MLLALVPGASCTTVALRPRASVVPDICSRITLSVADGRAVVASGTMRALTTRGAVRLAALRPGSAVTVSLAVRLDPDVDDSYQGLSARFPMRWSVGQT